MLFGFTFLKYILYAIFLFAGVNLYNSRKTSNKDYWKLVLPIILFYSFMEGCRWNRATDYMEYYDIFHGLYETGDIFFDWIAYALRTIGFPYYVFFICMSMILIISLLRMTRDFKDAFIPCIFLLYIFSMGQSENIVRQWCAESFMIISFCTFFDKKYLWAAVFLILGFLTHKSIVFILPFFIVGVIIYKRFEGLKKNKWVPIVFLVLLLVSEFLKNYLEDYFQTLNFTLGLSERSGFSDERLGSVFNNYDAVDAETHSMVFYLRQYLRYISVIVLGFLITKKQTFERNDNFLYVAYFLACCGIIYRAILPQMHMEFLSRAGLYLDLFIYFMEGLLFYVFLMKKNGPKILSKQHLLHVKVCLLLLALLELIIILKPAEDAKMLFIWDRMM